MSALEMKHQRRQNLNCSQTRVTIAETTGSYLWENQTSSGKYNTYVVVPTVHPADAGVWSAIGIYLTIDGWRGRCMLSKNPRRASSYCQRKKPPQPVHKCLYCHLKLPCGKEKKGRRKVGWRWGGIARSNTSLHMQPPPCSTLSFRQDHQY